MTEQDATLPPAQLTVDGPIAEGAPIPALAVLWSRHEPQRIGEVFLVPDAEGPWLLGRGAPSPGERRLAPARQRPQQVEPTGALTCPRLSRAQLRITGLADGALAIENVGRCAMLVDGQPVERATLAPGAIVEIENELLLLCTRRAPALHALVDGARAHPFGEADAAGLVGESPALWAIRHTLTAVARRSAHVLVLGPSGAGKELVVQALHAMSPRAGRAIVARNAATLPEGLVDAELFGNLRSYPNPGTPERPGLIGQADGSTLFLDEIAELPSSVQAHLLRVLDQGEYQRLGEAVIRRSDLRMIGATNRPESALKHDVLARFKIRIALPGLDARREDIPLLAAHLLRAHAAADPEMFARFFPEGARGAFPRLAPALVRSLVSHRYTGNVRELDLLLHTAAVESAGGYLDRTETVRARGTVPTRDARRGEAFTEEERIRLDLQRKHRFRAAECGRDPDYPGNRQTADLHLRKLGCKALACVDWDVGEAAALLGGEDGDLRIRARARLDTFLENVERRLGDAGGERALRDEWRGSVELLGPLLDALGAGRVRGRREATGDAADEGRDARR